MALPASGTITMAQIQAEFGGANPISLSEYYKGGAYVSVTDYAPNVPASGAISLSNFYGAYKVVSTPLSATLSAYTAYGHRATIGVCTSNTITCTPSGGVPGYTYAWANITNTSVMVATNPTASASAFKMTFTITDINNSNLYQDTFRCTVTDSLGATTYQDVVVTLEAV